MNLRPGKNRKTTPEGEPLEDTGGGRGGASAGNATSSSSGRTGGNAGLQNVLNNTVLNNSTG